MFSVSSVFPRVQAMTVTHLDYCNRFPPLSTPHFLPLAIHSYRGTGTIFQKPKLDEVILLSKIFQLLLIDVRRKSKLLPTSRKVQRASTAPHTCPCQSLRTYD